jgi:16S rRNA (guanine527-N7)-methyltransferase
MDRGKTEAEPAVRTMPTPGAAPRGRTAREPLRRRVVDGPREPLPTRVEATPDLPPAYRAALDAGLAELSLVLTPAARVAIDGHARLLLAWTASINLTSIRDPAAVALAHVVDSLSGLAVLRERGIDRFIDLGSGGGYPGLPIAAVLPAARTLLLEPIAKKATFLTTVAAATGLAAAVEAAPVRAEALAADVRHRGRWPAVTARAVASLGILIELAFPLLVPGGVLIAWKRGALDDELAAAERAMTALGGGRLEVRAVDVTGLDGHRLVVATATGRVPPAYPRDPGARKRRPW